MPTRPISDGEFRGRVLQTLEQLCDEMASVRQELRTMADYGHRLGDLETWRRTLDTRQWHARWDGAHLLVIGAAAILSAVVGWLVR
jgi:hypothetical protein